MNALALASQFSYRRKHMSPEWPTAPDGGCRQDECWGNSHRGYELHDSHTARIVGCWIRDLREKEGLTQENVAHASGIAVSTYGRIERFFTGERWVSPSTNSFLTIAVTLRATERDFARLLSMLKSSGV